MAIKTLKDFDLKDMLVLIRIDINSPVVNGKVLDNPRFKASAETIKYLLDKQAKVVILAHQGRKGDRDFLPLEQHAKILSNYTSSKVKYINALFEDFALDEIDKLEQGQAILLKNVREYSDEIDIEDSRFYSFSKLFDLYVNDALSVSHRKQGSIIIPPEVIPSCIGISFEKEINALENLYLSKGKTIYLIGGAKIEDYFPIFNVLENKNNKILASGVLANLILISQGYNFGYENTWAKENNYEKLIPKIKDIYKKYPGQIILPVDFAVGNPDMKKASRKEVDLNKFPTNEKIWDVGTKTIGLFKSEIENAESIFMKGPLGYSEIEQFSLGTVSVLKEISKLSKEKKLFSLLGGGHLSETLEKYKIPNNFSYTSNSGGALIAFVSKNKLPGMEAIKKGYKKK